MEKAQVTAADLSSLFDAFNRHDIDAVMAYFAEDCVFNAVAGPQTYGTQFKGRDAIASAFAEVWNTMADARWDHHGHFVHHDRAVSEWTFSGTDRGGMRVEAEGCDLFTLREGKIIKKQAFRKHRPLMRHRQGAD